MSPPHPQPPVDNSDMQLLTQVTASFVSLGYQWLCPAQGGILHKALLLIFQL